MTIGGNDAAATRAAPRRIPSIVDGEDLDHDDWIDDVDPSTGSLLARIGAGDAATVDAAVASARRAADDGPWPRMAPRDRARVLRGIADRITDDAEALALLESRDTGKPLGQARADVAVAARYFEFTAGAVEALHGETIPAIPGTLAYTRREPHGVTAHIEPWNYPMQIGSRTLAPALAVGNCCVLKPAEEAPLTLHRLAHLALESGLPPGALNVVMGRGESAGAALAARPDIDHLSFTGSVAVGAEVAAAAARNVVPVALELGGKSPNIVFDDADLDRAVPIIATSILQNAGQTCSAGSRLLVHRRIRDEVLDRLAARFASVRIGPGPDDPDLGPLISAPQLARVEDAISAGLESADGARLHRGGHRARVAGHDGGFYFEPTLVECPDQRSPLVREEIFGPVVVARDFVDEDEAVRFADDSPYGLIAAVWTTDVGRAHRVAHRLRCGQVYVNTYGAGGGVELPFGGVGRSGYGREKGAEALLGFTRTKTVAVHLGEG
jgi:aldehyde dehydrogenase (NAD+)/betaine-aldehyde dehydrogenase